MDSFEWEVFRRTGQVDHYLLWKETEVINGGPDPLFDTVDLRE